MKYLNCINCGAPVDRKAENCAYCLTYYEVAPVVNYISKRSEITAKDVMLNMQANCMDAANAKGVSRWLNNNMHIAMAGAALLLLHKPRR